MLDDKPLLEHPTHGLVATRAAAAQQQSGGSMQQQRRRFMPSTVASKRNTVSGWFSSRVKRAKK